MRFQTSFIFSAFFSVLVVFLICPSCKEVIPQQADVIEIGALKEMEMIRYDNPDFMESYSLIRLEISEQSVLSKINQIQYFEDHLYVLDEKVNQLLVFRMDGSFSHRIGQQGRGPEEFRTAGSFYINSEQEYIVLFDRIGEKVLRYSLNGTLMDVRKPAEGVKLTGISNVAYLGGNALLCYAHPNGMMDEIMFTLNESNLSLVDILVTKPFDIDQAVYLASKQQFSLVNGALHFVKWFDDVVYSYKDGAIVPLIQMLGNPLVPEETLKEIGAKHSGKFTQVIYEVALGGTYSAGIKDLFETDRFIIATYPLGRMVVYDKERRDGVYVPQVLNTTFGLSDIIYSSGNTLICHWTPDAIKRFVDGLSEGTLNAGDYEKQIVDIATSFDPVQDNPVLVVFRMRK